MTNENKRMLASQLKSALGALQPFEDASGDIEFDMQIQIATNAIEMAQHRLKKIPVAADEE